MENNQVSYIEVERAGYINITRMNRPEKKNALTLSMYEDLVRSLKAAETDPTVRVHLITGVEDCFTSGNDVRDFIERPPVIEDSPAFRFLEALLNLEKPLIAAVNGLAVGVGVTMLLHCEMVLAAEQAKFQMPFVNLGAVPEAGSTLLLPQLVGYQQACEFILTGLPFTAEKAKQVGLVNHIYPLHDLMSEALSWADHIAQQPPAAVRLTKSLLKKPYATVLRQTVAQENIHFSQCIQGPESKEALTAFVEKRKPDFSKF